MNVLRRNIPVLIGLLLVCILSIVIRAHLFSQRDRKDEFSPFYHTECAIHMVYTGMISRGEQVPRVHKQGFLPDGFEVGRRLEMGQAYTVGLLHRMFFSRVPLRRFAEFFDWTWSALSVIAIFLITLSVTGKRRAALLAALFYCVAMAAIVRTVNGLYLREVFALPFLFFHFWVFLQSLRSRSFVWPVVGGALIAAAMCSWMISQFHFLILVSAAAGLWVWRKCDSGLGGSLLRFFSIQILFLVPAGLLNPYLRNLMFPILTPMLVTYALVTVLALAKSVPRLRGRGWTLPVVLVGLVAVLVIALPWKGEHGFVFPTALAKLKWFFRKPADPGLLSDAVRTIWVGSFRSPKIGSMIYILSTGLLVLASSWVLFVPALFRRKTNPGQELVLVFSAVYFFLYILFYRLYVFVAPFTAVLAGMLLAVSLEAGVPEGAVPRRGIPRSAVAILLLGACVFEFIKIWSAETPKPFFLGLLSNLRISSPDREFGLRTESLKDAIGWLKNNTRPGDGVLTGYSYSADILLYADRPVFQTPIFDSVSLKKKMLYETALYGPPLEFLRVCRDAGVAYVMYTVDLHLSDTPDSTRYQMNRLTFSTAQASYRMQFMPDRVDGFELVHQNEFVRIFRRSDLPSAVPAGPRPVEGYFPVYDERVYKASGLGPKAFLDAWASAWDACQLADRFMTRRQPDEAEQWYRSALNVFPAYPSAMIGMAKINLIRQRPDQAERYYRAAADIAFTADVEYGLAVVAMLRNDSASALRAVRSVLVKDPCYAPAAMDLAEFLIRTGRMSEAAGLCERMLECPDPNPEFRALLARTGRNPVQGVER